MKLAVRQPVHPHRPLTEAALSQVSGGDDTTVQAPRDVATGQSSGKRQHGYIRD